MLLIENWTILIGSCVSLISQGTVELFLESERASHPSILFLRWPDTLDHKFIVTWLIFRLSQLMPLGLPFGCLYFWLYGRKKFLSHLGCSGVDSGFIFWGLFLWKIRYFCGKNNIFLWIFLLCKIFNFKRLFYYYFIFISLLMFYWATYKAIVWYIIPL